MTEKVCGVEYIDYTKVKYKEIPRVVEYAEIPFCCDDKDEVAPNILRVDELPEVTEANKNVVYVTPDNNSFIVNKEGDGFIQLTGESIVNNHNYDDTLIIQEIERLKQSLVPLRVEVTTIPRTNVRPNFTQDSDGFNIDLRQGFVDVTDEQIDEFYRTPAIIRSTIELSIRVDYTYDGAPATKSFQVHRTMHTDSTLGIKHFSAIKNSPAGRVYLNGYDALYKTSGYRLNFSLDFDVYVRDRDNFVTASVTPYEVIPVNIPLSALKDGTPIEIVPNMYGVKENVPKKIKLTITRFNLLQSVMTDIYKLREA